MTSGRSALKPWHFLALSGLLWACARPKKEDPAVGTTDPMPDPDEPLEPVKDLFVFAHDATIIPTVMKAVRRIEAASGVKIHVNEFGTIATSNPIFTSDFLCANGTEGRTTMGGSIGLAKNCNIPLETVLVHELIHALGVGHLVPPQRGIMNELKDNPLDGISEDDLTALCSVRVCSKFQPEV